MCVHCTSVFGKSISKPQKFNFKKYKTVKISLLVNENILNVKS